MLKPSPDAPLRMTIVRGTLKRKEKGSKFSTEAGEPHMALSARLRLPRNVLAADGARRPDRHARLQHVRRRVPGRAVLQPERRRMGAGRRRHHLGIATAGLATAATSIRRRMVDHADADTVHRVRRQRVQVADRVGERLQYVRLLHDQRRPVGDRLERRDRLLVHHVLEIALSAVGRPDRDQLVADREPPVDVGRPALHDLRHVNAVVARDVLVADAARNREAEPLAALQQLDLLQLRGLGRWPLAPDVLWKSVCVCVIKCMFFFFW